MNALREALLSGLSEPMHVASVTREKDIFVVRLQDQEGTAHILEFWERNTSRKAYKSGQYLAFAYRPPPETSSSAFEQRVINSWMHNEEHITRAAREFVEVPVVRPESGRPLFWRESTISIRVARAWPGAGSVARAVRDAFAAEMSAMPPPSEVQIYFESACAQACEFCEEPQKRDFLHRRAAQRLLVLQHDAHLDVVSTGIFRELVLLTTEYGLPVRVTGHDWTRHPHREHLLRILENCEKTRIRLQGPSLAFESTSLARRIAALPGLEWVATTLQSADPDEHDAMVGARGAHGRLLNALENLQVAGVRVVLSVVLTRRAVRSLVKTLAFVKERGWRVELAAFVPDRALLHADDKLTPLDELHSELEKSDADAADAVASMVGIPYCAVPNGLRIKIAPVLGTRERDQLEFGLVCRTCTRRTTCSGVVSGYGRVFGERGLTALARD